MPPRTFSYDTPMLALGRELLFTIARLRAYPFLSAHTARFEEMFSRWMTLFQQELTLELAVQAATATTIVIDDQFDFLCKAIASALDSMTGRDRDSQEFKKYFGNITPSVLARPILGQELAVMRTWPKMLMAETRSADLVRYGQELAQRVEEADVALVALTEARNKLTEFEYGPRTRFIDELNALRHRTYGELAELYHHRSEASAGKGKKKPEGAGDIDIIKQRLPRDLASRFFMRDSGHRRKPTIADMEERVLRLRADLAKAEAVLSEMLEAEDSAEEARQSAELAAMEDELAALEHKRAELEARRAALAAQRKRSH